jgi:hypothetical protein
MALGPWEGRAVAFVLGCGLGVLLRMIWIMGVIAYRAFRGPRRETPVQYVVTEHYITEGPEGFIPPPGYAPVDGQGYEYLDVKVPLNISQELQDPATEQDDKA